MHSTYPGPLWFAGTGSFAASCLEVMSESAPLFSLIITLPPRPMGRKMKLQKTPVHLEADRLKLPVHITESPHRDPELLKLLSEEVPQAMVVVDFGCFIREPYLSTPPWGCLNIHPSLLPKYRGAAPVQRALMNGETLSGVSVFQLTQAMDAGPILHQDIIDLPPDANSGEILLSLAQRGGKNLLNVLQLLLKQEHILRLQNDDEASYAPKIAKEELAVDWNRSARDVHNLVRALAPKPSAYTVFQGKRVKLHKTRVEQRSGEPGKVESFSQGCPVVSCAQDSLVLLEVQPEGKKKQDGASWARGARIKEEMLFG